MAVRSWLVLLISHAYLCDGAMAVVCRHAPVVMAAKAKAGKGKAKATRAKAAGFGGGFGASPAKPLVIPSLELRTGARIPMLGFGTYTIEGDELRRALDHAIGAGYRHFDTARAYQNEALVGAAIAASGVPREEYFITTKLWTSDHGEQAARRAIEASLHELGTPYIDCMLVHGPDNLGQSAEEKVARR